MKKTIQRSVGHCFARILGAYSRFLKYTQQQQHSRERLLRIRYYRKQRLKQILLLLLLFSFQATTYGQVKPLKIGDQVPDLKLSVYQDAQFKDVHLSDYKGKLLIIDFWATWCGSCISKLAEDEAIQESLPDQVVFLLVNSLDTGDSELKATNFLKKWQQEHDVQITSPLVFEDNILNQYFKRTALPHYVWIDASGRVRAITRKEYITEANIKNALDHNEYNYPIKTF